MPQANEIDVTESRSVEALREAMTMVLYLSIVLLATLAALPSGGDSHGGGGIHGAQLIG